MTPNSKLLEALTIRKPRAESIYSIVGRMKVLLEYLERHRSLRNLIPFLETYYVITKTVAERRLEKKDTFKDIQQLEKLDIYFAQLYFEPIKKFLLNSTRLKPWQTYLNYCEKPGIPFLQMLLGINAHINGDLFTSLVKLKYREKSDYWKINKILEEEIPVIMKFLAYVDHDVYGLGGVIFKNFCCPRIQRLSSPLANLCLAQRSEGKFKKFPVLAKTSS